MSDAQKILTQVYRSLKKCLPKMGQNHLGTLALMMTGLVQGKNAQLSKMAAEAPSPVKTNSLFRRFQRWVSNEGIEVEVQYLPVVSALLRSLCLVPRQLVIDGSTVGRGCICIMVGIVYKNRLLPLTWLTYKGKKGHASSQLHLEILRQLMPLIPNDADITLLGDGEYDDTSMLALLTLNTKWHYVVRTAKNIQLGWGQQQQRIDEKLAVQPGKRRCMACMAFTEGRFGPVTAVAWWDKKYESPLYLLSNLTDESVICELYKKRFLIETFFSDSKSRGFHIEKSHLSAPERLQRLMLVACLAYLWMVYLGADALQKGAVTFLDHQSRCDKSLFRLGLDWLCYLLKNGLPLHVHFQVPS